jgi:hypothetical protein
VQVVGRARIGRDVARNAHCTLGAHIQLDAIELDCDDINRKGFWYVEMVRPRRSLDRLSGALTESSWAITLHSRVHTELGIEIEPGQVSVEKAVRQCRRTARRKRSASCRRWSSGTDEMR